MHDRVGEGFTLLRLGGTEADTGGLSRGFAAHGAPYAELAIGSQAARDVYGWDLLLVRPDVHVVWRGQRAPEEPERLAAVATGARTARPIVEPARLA